MNRASTLAALLFPLGLLAACDRPTVVNVPPPEPVQVPVPVPGPAGPTGSTGATGDTGATGQTGDGTTVIVVPSPASAASS